MHVQHLYVYETVKLTQSTCVYLDDLDLDGICMPFSDHSLLGVCVAALVVPRLRTADAADRQDAGGHPTPLDAETLGVERGV